MAEKIELTIYNNGMGFVKEKRDIEVEEGFNKISFGDVTDNIDASSVYVDTNDAGIKVLEQGFVHTEPITKTAMISKSKGMDIKLYVKDKDQEVPMKGKLLEVDGSDLIIKTDEGVRFVNYNSITNLLTADSVLEELGGKPTLDWLVESDKNTTQEIDVDYLTHGFGWANDYVMKVKNDGTVDLTSRFDISNHSGKDFKEVKLNFVAGELNTNHTRGAMKAMALESADASFAAGSSGVSNEQLGDFQLFVLERDSSLTNKEHKQVSFFDIKDIESKVKYTFDGHSKVNVSYTVENKENNKLGISLPMGNMKVYKDDKSGSSHYIGESHVPHTSKNDKLEAMVGNAFDIKASKEEVGYRVLKERPADPTNHHTSDMIVDEWEHDYKITFENKKDESVMIHVNEHLGRNAEIKNSGFVFTKAKGYGMKTKVQVEAGKKVELTYTILNKRQGRY